MNPWLVYFKINLGSMWICLKFLQSLTMYLKTWLKIWNIVHWMNKQNLEIQKAQLKMHW
jgi:hypothetical protein